MLSLTFAMLTFPFCAWQFFQKAFILTARHFHGLSKRLEYRFCLMMNLARINDPHMQRCFQRSAERFKKMLDKIWAGMPSYVRPELYIIGEMRATRNVYRNKGKRLIHRKHEIPCPVYAFFVSERLFKSFT